MSISSISTISWHTAEPICDFIFTTWSLLRHRHCPLLVQYTLHTPMSLTAAQGPARKRLSACPAQHAPQWWAKKFNARAATAGLALACLSLISRAFFVSLEPRSCSAVASHVYGPSICFFASRLFFHRLFSRPAPLTAWWSAIALPSLFLLLPHASVGRLCCWLAVPVRTVPSQRPPPLSAFASRWTAPLEHTVRLLFRTALAIFDRRSHSLATL